MANITLNYKGLTGKRGTITAADTATFISLITLIVADEDPTVGVLTNSDYDIALERDTSITDVANGSDPIAVGVGNLGLVNGDTIICIDDKKNLLTTNTKEVRQLRKLRIASVKRYAEGKANYTYDATSLPDTYNDNLPGADDNPNTGGLLPKRPWIAVSAIAAPTSITESVGGDSLVDLEIWYDGADESTIVPSGIADEDPVNQWNDKSGLAHNLNFDGGNNKPSYESSDTQNGYGYVQFADGDLMSINPLASLSGATAYTVFVIARSTDLATNATQILTSTENGELSIQIDTNGTARFKVGASSATTASSTVQEDEWNIYSLVYNGTANIVGRVNDGKLPSQNIVSAGAVAGPAAMGASTYLYVGGDNTGGTFIGDVGEVILFKKALNATEYANVENYLATKWGV
jgi:hypothetical protein